MQAAGPEGLCTLTGKTSLLGGECTSFQVETNSVDETISLGESLGQSFVGGLQIGLIGPLGAGKTHLVKGMALGNARDDAPSVTSPTFTLLHEYAGRLRLYHADLYRLADPGELTALGYEEWCTDDSVVVIEWADRFRSTLGDDVLWVELRPTGETRRSVIFEAKGKAAKGCLDRLQSVLR